MKKAYEFPKAEKMAFDYSDTVVASTIPQSCTLVSEYTDSGSLIVDGDCGVNPTGRRFWMYDQA